MDVEPLRSRIMKAVKQKHTGPELLLRSALHKRGIRFRLHARELPGSPDLVLPKYRAVIFVHGCYWHAHGCYRSTVPKTRETFWVEKFAANKARDARKVKALRAEGWRVLTVWECALKGRTAIGTDATADAVIEWLGSDDVLAELSGRSERAT